MSEKILFLGPPNSPVLLWLKGQGENVVQYEQPLTFEFIKAEHFKYLISFGYRYLIQESILAWFPGRAINLHISLLPWNRGSDPNFWSWVDDTPKGVTIHLIDKGLDTGNIIAQKSLLFNSNEETLATSYTRLQSEIIELFKAIWKPFSQEQLSVACQCGEGSYHKLSDKRQRFKTLPLGWDTPVSWL